MQQDEVLGGQPQPSPPAGRPLYSSGRDTQVGQGLRPISELEFAECSPYSLPTSNNRCASCQPVYC